MDIWKNAAGMVVVELICADPSMAISQINSCGITIYDVYRDENDIVVQFTVERRHFLKLQTLARKNGYRLTVKHRLGSYWSLRRLGKRPVLLVGLALFLTVTLYLPSRVLFLVIEGNETVPTKRILEACQNSGIAFGASRAQVRSERVKNRLLEEIPQLQWAGINTYGCVAVVSVSERAQHAEPEQDNPVASMVAIRDGVITQCTATNGTLLCKPGQAVKEGEILISGYADCGIQIRASKAEGEVFARTRRNLTVLAPSNWVRKDENHQVEKKYALIIGKKRINLYKGSGILDSTCDKMYLEYCLTLPGGFSLPVILVTEVYTYRATEQIQTDQPTAWDFVQSYLCQEMISGAILSKEEDVYALEGAYLLEGVYTCTEMIGRIRNEEIIKPYE